MVSFSLTSKRQKISCILIDLFFVSFYLVFIILRLGMGAAFYVFAGFVILLCAIYSLIIFNSRIKIDKENLKLHIYIFQKTTYDLKQVQEIRIQTKIMDKKEIKVISLFGFNNALVGEVNPHFAMGNYPRFDEIAEAIETLINKND